MSLYGALFGGVSGLKAQSSKIGVISDNIANVNTVGYKQSEALFQTLVLNASSSVSYQTGGVRGGSRMAVDKQGLLLSTDAPTDIAISGAGFFVVNQNANGTSQPLYTRAGSFRQDSLGNFVNAQGFYLQGWPLDREGRLPGEPGNLNTTSFANLDSLQTVNVQGASGIAQATTQVKLGANLDAAEVVFPGKALTTTFDKNDTINGGLTGEGIILGADYGFATANGLARGDSLEIATGNGLTYAYKYGGYTVGRDITTAGSVGDSLISNARVLDGAAGTLVESDWVSDGAGNFTITFPNSHGLVVGDKLTLTGSTDADAADGTYTITAINSANQVVVSGISNTLGAGASPGAGNFGAATLSYSPFASTGVIFDANNQNTVFFKDVSRFTEAALKFTISTGSDTHTFTYSNAANPTNLTFNSLSTLATAISTVNGLSARVANNRLVISAEDATQNLTFTNGDWPVGTVSQTQTGIDWVSELGLNDVTADDRRFNSLAGLAALVNGDEGVTSVLKNPLSTASLDIRVDDPLDTITMRDINNFPTLDLATLGASYTGAAAAAGSPITLTLDFGVATNFSTLYGISNGTVINLQNEDAAVITALGLPAGFPNIPGLSQGNSNYEIVVSNVNQATGTFDITIPAYYNSGGYAGAGPVAAVAGSLSVPSQSNQGSILSELFADTTDTVADPSINSLSGTTYLVAGPQSSGTLGPEYDPSGTVGKNMASGDIVAQFSRNVRVYDALGTGHDIRYSFIKVADNQWAVEVHAIPEDDISTSLPDGQITTGTITFNGDGSLRSVTSGLSNPFNIVWTNGAIPSTITPNWGTAGEPFGTPNATAIGDTDGLSQFDSDYDVAFFDQNGAPLGQLVSVSIDKDGFVIASYSNGETQNLYKLPIADFTNPNALHAISGNVFSETRESGPVNLREAGNSVGTIQSASLEQSNVDLSEQLTDMIVAQRAYQSNTRVISVTDDLLDKLNQL